ncbi:MAG: CPBP family intramembrane metalloprotease [Candidatus Marinimicrobia bacterium]|nr:CPBP family intramembrane metalloprotease [Candidatus Neomarinimicrobiota bacterium]
MKDYFSLSKTPFYSFVFTVPLFILYEIGVLAVADDDIYILRNGADVFLRQILESFGVMGLYGFSGLLFLGFLGTFMYQRHTWEDTTLNSNTLISMLFESIFWAIVLYFSLAHVMVTLMNPIGIMMTQQVVLALGAGLYEEFLFRVLLIAGIGALLTMLFQWNDSFAKWIGMFLSAIIFSLFHFMGDFGDDFHFNIFFIRFFAGLILGTLYMLRGFGITAYAHSIYDLIVLTRMTTIGY